MSKELEALHTIAFNTQFIAGMNFGNELRTIEKALLELKAIKEAKPSEALERLENNRNAIPYAIDYRIIKQALIKAQEQEKIFNIIKKYLFNENDEPTQEEIDLLNTYFGYNVQKR